MMEKHVKKMSHTMTLLLSLTIISHIGKLSTTNPSSSSYPVRMATALLQASLLILSMERTANLPSYPYSSFLSASSFSSSPSCRAWRIIGSGARPLPCPFILLVLVGIEINPGPNMEEVKAAIIAMIGNDPNPEMLRRMAALINIMNEF